MTEARYLRSWTRPSIQVYRALIGVAATMSRFVSNGASASALSLFVCLSLPHSFPLSLNRKGLCRFLSNHKLPHKLVPDLDIPPMTFICVGIQRFVTMTKLAPISRLIEIQLGLYKLGVLPTVGPSRLDLFRLVAVVHLTIFVLGLSRSFGSNVWLDGRPIKSFSRCVPYPQIGGPLFTVQHRTTSVS